ncbi:hypothetical protein OUZ56_014759 [Daphnia magna]|uniref:Uncharacterized protein n=1 Tax=Daphnia magna TaxID=35525 RepID=A0ABR0AKQ5_9CRUS|nr:hypothetical protein OUZ56_014759 [Daphnia magna]
MKSRQTTNAGLQDRNNVTPTAINGAVFNYVRLSLYKKSGNRRADIKCLRLYGVSTTAISGNRETIGTAKEKEGQSLHIDRYKSELGAWSMVLKIDKTCLYMLFIAVSCEIKWIQGHSGS